MTYTYDPTQIGEKCVSRVRFELGDTMVEGEGDACFLCDEEITSVIESVKNWKKALYKLADGVCKKLSYETDWHDDGAAFSLNQRAERWKAIRDELKKEATLSTGIPKSGAVDDSLNNQTDGGHYYRAGMMQSPYVQPPSPFGGGST